MLNTTGLRPRGLRDDTMSVDGPQDAASTGGASLGAQQNEAPGADPPPSDAHYRALMEQAADAILVSDVNGNLIDANAVACQLTGYSRDELLQLNIVDTYPPEDLQLAMERTAALVRGARLVTERRLRRKDGVDVPVSISVRRLADGRVQGIFHDLTERKRAEEALRKSEEKFAKLFHSAPVEIAVSGLGDGVFLEVNREFERLLGYTRGEIMGRCALDLGLWVDPTLRERIVTRLLAGDYVSDRELELRAKDGTILTVRGSLQRLELDGEAYLLSAFVDVTESRGAREALRRSEEYFRSLIEQALDIITVLNPDGTIRYSSPANERVLGYRPDELRGHLVFDFVHPDDRAVAAGTFFEGLQQQGEVRSLQVRFRHKNGSWRILEVVGRNLCNDPVVAGAIINAHDVTERHSLEAQLRLAQKMEAVGQLAGGVAHDFNNFLFVILGWTKMALDDLPGDSSVRPSLEKVLKAGENAATLTRQLLALSRQEVVRPTFFSVNTLVAEMDKMFGHLLGEDIEIVPKMDPELGTVEMDRAQLEQVLMNLAINARDAMPTGGKLTLETANVVLDARYRRRDTDVAPGEYVMLAVSDTGMGMSEEVAAHMFEPFFTTKAAGKGTGLGLATSYGIIKQAGGQITVYSQEGLGTTMRVYLPRSHAAADAVVPARENQSVHGVETILVVEDEPAVRQLTVQILTRQGYHVLTADSGEQALRVIEEAREPVHLLLTDIVLGAGVSGPGLAERVHATRPDLKVVFVSGYAGDVTTRHGLMQSGISLVQKPFTADVLGRKVRDVLDAD